MQSGFLAGAVLALLLLLAACTSEGPGNPDEAMALAQFTTRGARHEFGVFPNEQGPDAPCVGLSVSDANGSSVTLACPTEPTEISEYAASIELDTGVFVVGYGLQEGETITADGASQLVLARSSSGHQFYVIELTEAPGSEGTEIFITGPDYTRSIVSHAPVS